MTPLFSQHNIADGARADAELLCERCVGDFPGPVPPSNLKDVSFRELRVAIPLTTVGMAPTFRVHIGHVVGVSTEKKMRRVYANWNVALVQDTETRRDWAVDNLPCDAVSAAPATIHVKSSVSLLRRGIPKPALGSLRNLCPKPSCYAVVVHRSPPVLGPEFDVTASPGPFFREAA